MCTKLAYFDEGSQRFPAASKLLRDKSVLGSVLHFSSIERINANSTKVDACYSNGHVRTSI